MNYPYPPASSPYIHPNMSQAIQAIILGTQLSPNCIIMAMPIQQAQQILPQLLMNSALNNAGDQMIYPPPSPYYGSVPQQKYNYSIVPYKSSKKKSSHSQQPHPNIYNSSSFDTYMEDLSWSRLFNRPSRKSTKQQDQISKNSRSNSSTSTTISTTSDETIRRVNVPNKPSSSSSNTNSKQQTKGSLPFKYSSEFVPGIGKQQGKKIKSNDVFIIKKP